MIRFFCGVWCVAAFWLFVTLMKAVPDSVLDTLPVSIQTCVIVVAVALMLSIWVSVFLAVAYG